MIGYPLDSHVTFKTDGTPVFDRAISSAPYRKLIKSLFSDGVLPNPSTNLQVSAGTGMKVNLYAGFAICNGCQKLQESNTALDIATASAVNDRIDTVVLRLNDNDDVRECEFYVLTGTPAVAPVRPALTQTDSIWEIGLADVLVKANSTQISNANITDTRYETARCGVISSISEFDTTTLYQQIQSDLQEFREVNQANFIAWVESLKSKLAENVAANLQLQIDEINENHQLKTYLSPKLMDSTKDWSNFALKDLKAGRKLVATLAAAEDISNAYANGVIPVAVAGTLTGINANNTGYYQYVTITGETYINSSESILGNVFTGWKQMVDILSSKEEVEANTTAGKVVDALVVKDINSSLTELANYLGYEFGSLIPKLSDDSTSIITSGYTTSGYGYYAFDKYENTSYVSNTYGTSDHAYIGYDFGNKQQISKCKVVFINKDTVSDNVSIKIQGSNDNSNWTDISTFSTGTLDVGATYKYTKEVSANYRYYRAYKVSSTANSRFAIAEIDFYK